MPSRALVQHLYHLQQNPLKFQVNPPLTRTCLPVIVRFQRLRHCLGIVKCGTATGPDGITAWMLRTFSESVSPSISSLFNLSIRTGKLPSNWKLSNVVPIPKETSLCHDVRSFRPMSIIRKCLEKHLFHLLLEHFEQNSVLSDHQFGFRSGRSTMIPLLTSVHDWQQSLERKQRVLCVFIDIKKAFDSVPHQALLNKLCSLNIPFILHRWLTIYVQGCNVLSLVVPSPRGSQLSQVFFRALSWGPCFFVVH